MQDLTPTSLWKQADGPARISIVASMLGLVFGILLLALGGESSGSGWGMATMLWGLLLVADISGVVLRAKLSREKQLRDEERELLHQEISENLSKDEQIAWYKGRLMLLEQEAVVEQEASWAEVQR